LALGVVRRRLVVDEVWMDELVGRVEVPALEHLLGQATREILVLI
jgi:hypothetical protein